MLLLLSAQGATNPPTGSTTGIAGIQASVIVIATR